MNDQSKGELSQPEAQKRNKQKLSNENATIPFTARLMAYYRTKEYKNNNPLITDPFAERLAGDMSSFLNKHKLYTEMDYPLVRSYYIEENLLRPWCNMNAKSQIVLLGAGLDTRAYRFEPLQPNTHTIFEIDFPLVIQYKEEILKDEQPLCGLNRLSADLSKLEWISALIQSGFSNGIPTFWILEGLVYYMDQEVVASLLIKIAEISAGTSQIFVDICIPALAEVELGPFSKHFKWGLSIKAAPLFFATVGWNVSCSYADAHDQSRDVGQKGLIFIQGVRVITA